MEQLAVTTATNLTNFALSCYDMAEKTIDNFDETSPESHFNVFMDCVDKFLDAAYDSEYLEDMEDTLGAAMAAMIGISVSSGLFTKPVEV